MNRLTRIFSFIIVMSVISASTAFAAHAQKPASSGDGVTVTWLGQSAFKLEHGGKTIFIDPFITGNPNCPITLGDIKTADYILVTHDHFDHVGDTIELAKKTGAIVIANYDTVAKFQANGLPPENVLLGGFGRNVGGSMDFDGFSLVMTPAIHSSASGSPCGYIIRFSDGTSIYHAGDTGIFSDMELYARLYPVDVAILPIGNIMTMDAFQAAESLRMIRPKTAIPMHYGSFFLEPSADEFVKQAKRTAPEVDVMVLTPGQGYVFHGGRHK